MAGIAVGWSSRVYSPNVAVRALYGCMSPGKGKGRVFVIEHRGGPGSSAVANGTILRETGRNVVGIGCAVIARQMARGGPSCPIRPRLGL